MRTPRYIEFPRLERIVTALAGWSTGCFVMATYIHWAAKAPVPTWVQVQMLIAGVAYVGYTFWTSR